MEKSHFIKSVALLLICCAMFGCGKDEPQASQTTTIYGTVFNKVTHEPVNGAQVKYGYYKASNMLVNGHPMNTERYSISSAISGYDGQFEMQFEEVQYDLDWNDGFYISATCDGYEGYYSSAVESIGGTYRLDINLEPEPELIESFAISINGVETDTLYLSNANTSGTFLVTNNGSVEVKVYFSDSSDDIWIGNNEGNELLWVRLQSNEGYSVVVRKGGAGIGYIYANSSQISKTIVVKKM